MAASRKYPFLALALGLSACAPPDGEGWPTISFGSDIAAMDSAIDGPSGVMLAPLPGLGADERAGSENPQGYFADMQEAFFAVKGRLADRLVDYQAARAAYTSATGERSYQSWLTAQMELSNISQATEAIKTIRAQLALVSGDVPAAADFIAAAEALELEYREFLLNQRLYLAQNQP